MIRIDRPGKDRDVAVPQLVVAFPREGCIGLRFEHVTERRTKIPQRNIAAHLGDGFIARLTIDGYHAVVLLLAEVTQLDSQRVIRLPLQGPAAFGMAGGGTAGFLCADKIRETAAVFERLLTDLFYQRGLFGVRWRRSLRQSSRTEDQSWREEYEEPGN